MKVAKRQIRFYFLNNLRADADKGHTVRCRSAILRFMRARLLLTYTFASGGHGRYHSLYLLID